MTIEELRNIPIWELLSHLGIEPVSMNTGRTQLMYRSPLREDVTASFTVSTRKNLWMDFGTSQGGNVIDLAIALNGNCSFREAAAWLERQARSIGRGGSLADLRVSLDRQPARNSGGSPVSSVRLVPLESPGLLAYLRSRGIPEDIGKAYCKEAHYSVGGRDYYGIAFPNILGGMEIRNPFFKGSFGSKGPTLVTLEKGRKTPCCCLFEGFMDFLSYLTLQRCSDEGVALPFPCDCIIMNSTSLVRKTVPFIGVYEKAYCYLDNDDAGLRAFGVIGQALPGKAFLKSDLFADFNDLNDYLTGRRRRG